MITKGDFISGVVPLVRLLGSFDDAFFVDTKDEPTALPKCPQGPEMITDTACKVKRVVLKVQLKVKLQPQQTIQSLNKLYKAPTDYTEPRQLVQTSQKINT